MINTNAKLMEVMRIATARMYDVGIKPIDAELLMAAAVGCTRQYLLLHPESIQLNHKSLDTFQTLVQRRLQGEPMSQILGYREFWSREFKVSRDVLTPRPDSEVLIECVLDYMANKTAPYHILDLGTGSGCLLITLLCEYPNTQGVGVDLSTAALSIAKHNASQHGVASRAQLLQSDWLSALPQDAVFDIIVANPPYIPLKDMSLLPIEVREYEPHYTLTDNADGLRHYKQIASTLLPYLAENAHMFFEIGIGQEEEVCAILQELGFFILEVRADLAGVLRCVVAIEKNRGPDI